MSNKYLHAIYEDEDILIDSIKLMRKEGIKIKEVYTPFPVHGLDSALGLKRTRIAIASFVYGVIGLLVAVWMTNYMMIQDWPQDIGGKPSGTWFDNMPSFVPIIFELTVFFAAHFMVITYFFRNNLYPSKEAENPDVRTTDDKFLVEIDLGENQNNDVEKVVGKTKVFEVNKK